MLGLFLDDYRGLSASEYKGKLEGVLRSNSKIFESRTLNFKIPGGLRKGGRVSFFAPAPIAEGEWFLLKGGLGSIGVHECWILDNRLKITQRVNYSYRLRVNGWQYSCCSGDPKNSPSWTGVYNFRYEKDEKKEDFTHPSPHLHVIHSEPHYYAREMTFRQFLEYVKANFFDGAMSDWKLIPIWLR